jgi:sugar lactone lactonase YvrE
MVARSGRGFRPAGAPLLRGLAAGALLLLALAGCSGEEPPRPDFRTGEPILGGAGALEEVARLRSPLGNVAVSEGGRVFITYHPLAKPAVKVAEILPDGTSVPYPDAAWQSKEDGFQTPQGIVLDGSGRLWVLDHGRNGFGTPALFGFDIATGELAHRHDFRRGEAGWGSYLNDLSVDTETDTAYIADTANYNFDPALLVYDIETQKARRVLEDHASVKEEAVDMRVEGEKVTVLGAMPLRVAVDSIVLDLASEYLYYGPMSGTTMYRIPTAALLDASLSPEALAAEVRTFAPKPLSDGITIDAEGTLYLTAIEERAIMVIAPNGQGATLVRDERLVWPSQLNRILFKSEEEIARTAPHILYRFRALAPGLPGR